MSHASRRPSFKGPLLAATLLTCAAASARADDGKLDNSGLAPAPSGQTITPLATPGAVFVNPTVTIPTLINPTVRPDGAIQSALNPADKRTLVVMTSGYNTYDTATGGGPGAYNGVVGPEYIFVYDVANPLAPVRNMNPQGTGAAALTPQDTFQGMIWSPDGAKLYVSGGTDADVLVYGFNLATRTGRTAIRSSAARTRRTTPKGRTRTSASATTPTAAAPTTPPAPWRCARSKAPATPSPTPPPTPTAATRCPAAPST